MKINAQEPGKTEDGAAAVNPPVVPNPEGEGAGKVSEVEEDFVADETADDDQADGDDDDADDQEEEETETESEDDDSEDDETEGDDDATVEAGKDENPAEAAVETKPDEGKDEQPGAPEAIDDPLKVFKPEYVPGTTEYLDRLTKDATARACDRLGIKDVEDFDPYNPKHTNAMNFFFARLDQSATKDFEDAKAELLNERKEKKQRAAFDQAKNKAGSEIDKILSSKELKQKYLDALENMTVKDHKKALEAAKQNHDFTAFVDIAKRITGVKANLERVKKNQSQQAASNQGRVSGTSPRKPGSEVFGF